ncbi:spore coat protein U domain-containing protein [Phyllobacterium zundukense]|uniref:Spore coat protein U domain-containing protein n=1 Tax=Phyllobacterium zundukense TaxID=1867719 RepID=A0ACD4D296_9HYPH|nr:spore coat protein U domain-containing protein [Phyllobacterium zundukense]UXN59967.1 spore coat protein U domain-containing protein [Phyllobacterium zundukense]
MRIAESFVIVSVLGLFQQPVRVCMSLGAGTGGTDTNWRYMVGPNNKKIRYQLYGQANHVNPYKVGTSVANNMTLGFSLIKLFQWVPSNSDFDIHGWIPDQTGLEEGVYTDMIQASFRYDEGAGTDCSFTSGKTATASFQVRVQVKPFCALDVSQHIDFGSWQDLDKPRDQEGAVTVNCDKNTSYSLKLGWGGQGDAGNTRNMANGSEKISYNLFSDKQRSVLWGDKDGGKVPSALTSDGNKKTFPVYARVPTQKTPSPGTYTDNVVVTLEYK